MDKGISYIERSGFSILLLDDIRTEVTKSVPFHTFDNRAGGTPLGNGVVDGVTDGINDGDDEIDDEEEMDADGVGVFDSEGGITLLEGEEPTDGELDTLAVDVEVTEVEGVDVDDGEGCERK